MTMTFATLVFLPLAVWAAFRTSRTVAVLAASVGFSGSAVFNIPALQFGFQPYHLFGTLLVVRALLDARVRRTERKRRRITWVLYALGGFWFVAFMGVATAEPVEADRFYMVSQLIHLGFGISVTWALSRVVRTPETLRAACRGLERGAVFIAAWAIMQFTLNGLGREYPAFLFNNSIGEYSSLSGHAFGVAGLIRAGSVATEPSFLGRSLVIALAVLMVRNARGSAPQRRWMVGAALVIAIGLLMATSSTGLFGLAILLGVGLVSGRKLRIHRLAIFVATAGALVPVVSPALADGLVEATIGKSDTFSYQGRLLSMQIGRELFWEHQWLGVGWGNLTVHDLPYKVLSNTGIAGAVCLLVVLFGLLVGRVRPEHAGTLRPVLRGLKLAVAMSVAMDWVAGFSYAYGDLWVISGLLLAAMTLGPDSLPQPPAAKPSPVDRPLPATEPVRAHVPSQESAAVTAQR